jgi:hypothetical protein
MKKQVKILKIPKSKFLVAIYDNLNKTPLNFLFSTSKFIDTIEIDENFEHYNVYQELFSNNIIVKKEINKEAKFNLKLNLYIIDKSIMSFLISYYGMNCFYVHSKSDIHQLQTKYGKAFIFLNK